MAVDDGPCVTVWPYPEPLAPHVRGFGRQIVCLGGTFDGLLRLAGAAPAWCATLHHAQLLAARDAEAKVALAMFAAEAAAVTGRPLPAPPPRATAFGHAEAQVPDLSPSRLLLVDVTGTGSVSTAVVASRLLGCALAPDAPGRLPRRMRIRLSARVVPEAHRRRWLDGLASVEPVPGSSAPGAALAAMLAAALPTPTSVAGAPPVPDDLSGSVDALLSALAVRLSLRESGVLPPVTDLDATDLDRPNASTPTGTGTHP
ncbi:MAG: hypothetical protein D6705_01835 [Deltaproteobacteria bacterium]|nr:MAG: hypothetical protein D6705_01835 [Deltaproteobacteria bacterium]